MVLENNKPLIFEMTTNGCMCVCVSVSGLFCWIEAFRGFGIIIGFVYRTHLVCVDNGWMDERALLAAPFVVDSKTIF